MESFACQEVASCPAEEAAPAPLRSRRLAVAFRFDNLRDRQAQPTPAPSPAIAVPAYSRIVYRAGAAHVR